MWFLVSDQTVWLVDVPGPGNLSVAEDGTWLSLAGQVSLVTDSTVVEGLGDPVSDAWFQEGQEPVALRFEVVHGAWWTAPSFARTALEVAKAKLTGTTPEAGDHGRVA